MKNGIRVLSLLLVITMLAVLAIACTATKDKAADPAATTPAPGTTSTSTAVPKEEPLKVNVMLMHTYQNNPAADNFMHKWILARFNY